MEHERRCPFCASSDPEAFGTRRGATFARCRSCQSIYRTLSLEAFAELHEDAFEQDDFLERVLASEPEGPGTDRWDALGLAGTSVLEIGPGAGHLLAGAAARGRSVAAVETSARHRDHLRSAWGFDAVYPTLDDLPDGYQADVAVAVNVLEHVYDVDSFLQGIRARLAPGGALYLSTPNARALVCSLAGTMWSMFKEPDHVSFPSSAGLRAAASRTGYTVERIWSAEMAFETPAGFLVAARDRRIERREPPALGNPGPVVATTGRGSSALARIDRMAIARYEPTRQLMRALGRAGTIKAILRRS